MAAFDYKCPNGHINEHFLRSFADRVQCLDCGVEAEYLPSFYYSSRAAQAFDPVVIHKDAQGNVRLPAHSSAPVPEGFEKVELRTSREVYAFERQMNAKDAAIAADFHAKNEAHRDGQIRHNRGEIQEYLNGKAWVDGTGERHVGFSNRGRRFYEAMREQSEKRRHEAVRPEFVVEAFSYNASNRQGYHDPSVSFGKGRK